MTTAAEREIRELRAQVAMLTDTVVMAAALWFGQLDNEPSQRDYASETLHLTALNLVAANPRLAGAYQ